MSYNTSFIPTPAHIPKSTSAYVTSARSRSAINMKQHHTNLRRNSLRHTWGGNSDCHTRISYLSSPLCAPDKLPQLFLQPLRPLTHNPPAFPLSLMTRRQPEILKTVPKIDPKPELTFPQGLLHNLRVVSQTPHTPHPHINHMPT